MTQEQHPITPPPEPTDEELLRLAASAIEPYESCGIALNEYEAESKAAVEVYGSELIAFARSALARWGNTTPQPVPVSERMPGPEDCIANPRNGQGQWCWGWCVEDSAVPFSGRWRMMRNPWLADEASHWLPAHALPIPGDNQQ